MTLTIEDIRMRWPGVLLAFAAIAGLAACGGGDRSPATEKSDWVGVWATAPYGPFPAGPLGVLVPIEGPVLPPVPVFPGNQARDQSFRMLVHPTLGGERLRLRFSNLTGDRPLTLSSVRVAVALLGPAVNPARDAVVHFDGRPQAVIAPGAEQLSDPVELPFAVGENLAISFHVDGESGPMTWHAVAFDVSYVGLPGTGDTTGDTSGLSFTQPTIGWFFLNGVDVERADALGSIVAIGDSITDGAFQVPATNTRWPDGLASRLQSAGIPMGVLNLGINSNTVTAAPDLSVNEGEPLVQRFERDVLQRAGVRAVLIFEGTNDIPRGVTAEAVYAGLRAVAARAQRAGLCAVVGTIAPRLDVAPYGWNVVEHEPVRQQLNALIRQSTAFDAVADFDVVLRNPVLPNTPFLPYYFPDLLHPNSLGFQRIAAAVPLEALVPAPVGRCARTP
ncbi:MAG TPA: GDSL-type esterase/lipase family protein [Solimonas sp.]